MGHQTKTPPLLRRHHLPPSRPRPPSRLPIHRNTTKKTYRTSHRDHERIFGCFRALAVFAESGFCDKLGVQEIGKRNVDWEFEGDGGIGAVEWGGYWLAVAVEGGEFAYECGGIVGIRDELVNKERTKLTNGKNLQLKQKLRRQRDPLRLPLYQIRLPNATAPLSTHAQITHGHTENLVCLVRPPSQFDVQSQLNCRIHDQQRTFYRPGISIEITSKNLQPKRILRRSRKGANIRLRQIPATILPGHFQRFTHLGAPWNRKRQQRR